MIIAAITGASLLYVAVSLVVAFAIWYLGTWALRAIAPGEPFLKIATIILVLLVVLIVANALLSLVGHPLISW